MSMKTFGKNARFQFLGILSWMLRKVRPASGDACMLVQQLQDLERLALVSPHLLEDVGFKKDVLRSNTLTECLRNGAIVILIRSDPPCVIAQSTPNFTVKLDQRSLRDAAVSPRIFEDHRLQNDLIFAEPIRVHVSREQVEIVNAQTEGIRSSRKSSGSCRDAPTPWQNRVLHLPSDAIRDLTHGEASFVTTNV